jgi:hypothetical protein
MSSCRGRAEAASCGRTGQLFTVKSLISVYTTLICRFLLYNELLRRLNGGIYIESAAAVIGDILDGSKTAAEHFLRRSWQLTVIWQQQQDFNNSPSSHHVMLGSPKSDGQGMRSSPVFACSISRPCSQWLGGVV